MVRADSEAHEALLDLLRPGIEAWNTGDVEAALELVDPGIAWYSAQVFPDIEPVYHGHEGVRRFWSTFVEPWEEIRLEVEGVLGQSGSAEAGTLAIRARFRARGREQIELDLRVYQVFVFRAGKLVVFRVFLEPGEALEAAGLD